MNAAEILKWVNLGLSFAEAAARGVETAIEGRDLVKRLVAEGRDPTDEEWTRINKVIDDLVASIGSA